MANSKHTAEDRLLAETHAAFRQHEKAWAGSEMSRAALQVGDVIVPQQLQEYEVEWAVVAQNRGTSMDETGSLLVVPADGGTLVGSGDLAVDNTEGGGPWTLRCGHGVWLAEERLHPWSRTGRLSEEDARRARERWWRMATGSAVGSTLEQELDEDPERQEWLEELVIPARRALLAPPVADSVPARSTERLWQGVAVAASLLVVLAGVWIGMERSRLDALQRAGSLANPQNIQFLMDGRNEGVVKDSVRPEASHVLWVVSLAPEMRAQGYRLQLVRIDSSEEVWTEDRLVEVTEDQLLAGTPTSLLTAGEYAMRLYALREGAQSELLGEKKIHFHLPKDVEGGA